MTSSYSSLRNTTLFPLPYPTLPSYVTTLILLKCHLLSIFLLLSLFQVILWHYLGWIFLNHRFWHGSINMMTLAFIFISHSTFPAASSQFVSKAGGLSQRSNPPLSGATKEIYMHSEVFAQLWLSCLNTGIISSNHHSVIKFRNTNQASQI